MYSWNHNLDPRQAVDTRPNHMDKPKDTRAKTIIAGIISGIVALGASWSWLIPVARTARGYPVTVGIEHVVAVIIGAGVAVIVMVGVDGTKKTAHRRPRTHQYNSAFEEVWQC